MAPKPQPEWSIYKNQLDFFCYGDALWQPSPVDYTRVAIGDVGFIRRGRFHLLFSAGSPLGERERGEDVPVTFEQLRVGRTARDQPRLPRCLCTTTVREIGAGLGATAPTTLPLEPGANFSFELTGNRGAALVTKYSTYKEDSLLDSAFERYTKRHYKSWVEFSRRKNYGNDVRPILVSGVDMTRDFAMVAYSYEDTSLGSDLTIAAPTFISASASLWGRWRTRYTPHTNYGPQECTPPEQVMDIPPLQPTEGGTTSGSFNQCVFIRYYTMRSRGPLRPFPKVIRAGAGPHDLGPGDNAGGTFPALVSQSDIEMTDDFGVESDVVIHNTPNDKDYDSWSAVADYVFQNSNAVSVLMHHRDLIGIRTADDADDIPSLLARHKPRIVVDESGVGRIDCQKLWRRGTSANRPTLRNITMLPPTSPALKRLYGLDKSSFKFHDELSDVLNEKEFAQWVPTFQGEDLVWFIDYLDKVLGILRPASAAFQPCLRELGSICGARAMLPSSYIIPAQLLDISEQPVASGSSGDLYEGTLGGSSVCVKRFRAYPMGEPTDPAQTIYQAATVWGHLEHQNVVSLLGVTPTPLQLISEWMDGGNILEYIGKNPDAGRVSLLSDVATGLQFLHSCNVVHGNLKGSNVLIDPNGHARITDIGLASITQNLGFMRSDPVDWAYTARWTAPEILDGRVECSMKSDIFSFAMVMVEVFTGAVPFNDRSGAMAIPAIQQGGRPPRPTHPTFTEELWMLMQKCWNHDPSMRMEVSKVLQRLLDSTSPDWKLFINDSLPEWKRISLATHIFSTQDKAELAESLTGEDAQNFVDAIDEVLENLPPETRLESLRCLHMICGRQGIVPRSLVIPLQAGYDLMRPLLRRRGVVKRKYHNREVAVKVLWVDLGTDFDKMKSRFCREVVLWRALRHPAILPLQGVAMADTQLVMVSEWMTNGTIKEFVKSHRSVDRLELLRDVTRGLIFLHDQGLAHGALRGENILVDNDGRACLAGFGLLTTITEKAATTLSVRGSRAIPWTSPELLSSKKSSHEADHSTRESDCYALGMVIYEVLSGRAPFSSYRFAWGIADKVLGGERPKKPEGGRGAWFTSEIWTMLELCWKPQPADRPSSRDILQGLERAQPPSSPGTHSDSENSEPDVVSRGPIHYPIATRQIFEAREFVRDGRKKSNATSSKLPGP